MPIKPPSTLENIEDMEIEENEDIEEFDDTEPYDIEDDYEDDTDNIEEPDEDDLEELDNGEVVKKNVYEKRDAERTPSAIGEKIDEDNAESALRNMMPSETDNALKETLKVLFDSDIDLDKKSELNQNQIIHMSRAKTIADEYELPILTQFITNIQRMTISKDRKGREEIVKVTGGYRNDMMGYDDPMGGGMFKKLFG